MAQPVASFYKADNSAVVDRWDIGEINAKSDSPVLAVSAWNNRAGATDVSDMRDVSITVFDKTGGDTTPLVVGKWLKCQMPTGTTAAFTPIGGATVLPVRAEGLLPADGNVIKGTANDGTLENAKANYSLMNFMFSIPMNAPEGLHEFLVHMEFFYT